MSIRILLKDLCLDGGTQTRAAVNQDRVAEYAELLRDGESFPPIIVFYDGATYWPADGFHRAYAHKAAGRVHIEADVRNGSKADCIRFAVGANKEHDKSGLRRTNADKRHSVEMLLNLLKEEGQNWSSVMIAEHCGVSRFLVDTMRPAFNACGDNAPRLGRDGRVQKQMGHPKRKPEPKSFESMEEAVSAAFSDDAKAPARSEAEKWKPSVVPNIASLDNRIKSLSDDGMPASEISKVLGCSVSRVHDGKRRTGANKKDDNPLLPLMTCATDMVDTLETAAETAPSRWAMASSEQRNGLVEKLNAIVGAALGLIQELNKEAPERQSA